MSGRYVIISLETNVVVNAIAWDGIAPFDPGEGYIVLEAEYAGIGWSYIGGVFIPPPVEELPLPVLAENKRTELRNLCSDEITRSSFQSDALGELHNYDCRLVDQVNLKVRYDVALSTDLTEPLWASDGTRFQWKGHSSGQIMSVMSAMNTHIKTSQIKLATKLAAVDAATNKAQIDAIIW